MSDQNNPYATTGTYAAPNVTLSTAPAGAPPAGDLIKETTTAGFAKDVIQESLKQPVLVDFWAPWCGPCRQLTPMIERAVKSAGGSVKLVKMNIDDHPSIAGQLGIQSIPAVIAFKNGQPVDGFMGAIPESQIAEFIRKVGGPAKSAGGVAEALEEAAKARTAGDNQGAAAIYDAVLQRAPDSVEAIAGLADLLFEGGETAGAEELLDSAPPEKRDDPLLASVRTRIALARQAAELGDPEPLKRRIEADPKDFQARFDLAMIQNAMGEREAAADSLLAIVRADRGWNNDGARAQLLKFFEAWGMTDEATLSARRKLSSVLFS